MRKRDYIIVILFALALMGAYSIYKPFLLSMVVALLLTMATANIHKDFTQYINSQSLSAFILTLLLFIILFVPIIYITTIGMQYLTNLDIQIIKNIVYKLSSLADGVPIIDDWITENLSDEKILETVKSFTSAITKAGTKGVSFIKDVFFVIVFYLILNLNAESIFNVMLKLLPMNDDEGEKMLEDISSTMEVVFYSIIVTAIFEGILFGIMVSFFHLDGLLFGMIYGFASLIPIVGGAIVWIPASLYAWNYLDINSAIFIAIYSVVVISIIADTFIKPMIIKYIKDNIVKSSININEIVIFFSILAGMSSYGFWGMILGPATTSFLIAISRVYIKLYGHNSDI